MNPDTKTGGPAFSKPEGVYSVSNDGMSLRDYFAGQALAGLSADPNFSIERAAKWAYGLADAMLMERDK